MLIERENHDARMKNESLRSSRVDSYGVLLPAVCNRRISIANWGNFLTREESLDWIRRKQREIKQGSSPRRYRRARTIITVRFDDKRVKRGSDRAGIVTRPVNGLFERFVSIKIQQAGGS